MVIWEQIKNDNRNNKPWMGVYVLAIKNCPKSDAQMDWVERQERGQKNTVN